MPPNTQHKFVVLLNKKLPTGVALNAASHMAACLVGRATEAEREQMMFLDYVDGNGNAHPTSGLSLIVLRADNSNKIRQAKESAKQANIRCIDFLESMTGESYVEQMARTKLLKEDELEYYGLCMFGEKEVLDTITRKFSLWRD
jgi:hypothetical protein